MPTIRINKENENAFHFLTLTTIEWVNIFTKPEYFKIIVESVSSQNFSVTPSHEMRETA